MTEEARRRRAEYQRAYREKNRDKLNAYRREWRKKNPEKVKKQIQDYWERKAAAQAAGAAEGE